MMPQALQHCTGIRGTIKMPNWHQVLEEIQSAKSQLEGPEDIIRRKYLKELHQKTGRNIISY